MTIADYFPPGSGMGQGTVILVTGPENSGKSTFANNMFPRSKTAIIDGEGSSRVFHEQNPFSMYIDVMEQYHYRHGLDEIDDGLYYQLVRDIFADVVHEASNLGILHVVFDNTKRYQSALADRVESDPEAFGLSANQIKNMGGLMWGAVKGQAEADILRLANAVGVVTLVVHLKEKWVNNKPSGIMMHSGLTVFSRMAILGVWLVPPRDPSQMAPAGLVFKDRIGMQVTVYPGDKPGGFRTEPDNLGEDMLVAIMREVDKYRDRYGDIPPWGTVLPMRVLPRRLPVASWAEIRRYMANPADWDALAPEEIPSATELALLQETLTPEQRKVMEYHQAQLEEAERVRSDAVQAAKDRLGKAVAAAKLDKNEFLNYARTQGLVGGVTPENVEHWEQMLETFLTPERC